MHTEPVAVIGAGPAGLAAYGQLELYGISPLVFEKDVPGGLLLNANCVQNYPGVRKGIQGRELAAKFQIPANILKKEVLSLKRLPSGSYELNTEKNTYHFDAVIAAPGTKPVRINVPGFPVSRVYYEVKNIPCNLYNSAAVIGGGDAALDYALTLSKAMTVNVYARNGFKKALPHLINTVENSSRITLHPGIDQPATHTEDMVLVACGREPDVAFISADLLCSPPADGSFHLCGDCVNGIHRQTAIAVGNGVMAAMKTAEYLK